ncbi:MAG: c(7)-type cytochrome triheme domain-containing protein [Rhodospirillales bacterium]
MPLQADYLHDPDNPALHLLQQPVEALSGLPRSKSGNHVDWIAALRSRDIAPRTNIQPETKVRLLDLDILFEETAGQPIVLFPHLQHTEWLDCTNCHDKPFLPKKGANPVTKLAILQGEYCGQCHGAVAFPLTACARCHSVPRQAKPPAS